VNLMLAGIGGAVLTAWNMGLVTAGELGAIMKGINSETSSGKRDAGIIALAYLWGTSKTRTCQPSSWQP
jgi:hypothetical protein